MNRWFFESDGHWATLILTRTKKKINKNLKSFFNCLALKKIKEDIPPGSGLKNL